MINLLCTFKGHLNGMLSLLQAGWWRAWGMCVQALSACGEHRECVSRHHHCLDMKFWIPQLCKSVYKDMQEPF